MAGFRQDAEKQVAHGILAMEAHPDEIGSADSIDGGGAKFYGVAADDTSHFGGIVNGIESGVESGVGAAKVAEELAHGRFGGDTGDSAAMEHALDGVERGEVEAIAKGEMHSTPVLGDVRGHRTGGFEERERNEIAVREMERLALEGKNGTSPLLAECTGELLIDDDVHLAKPLAETAVTRSALAAKRFAQLVIRDNAAIDEQQADWDAVGSGTFQSKAGKEIM